MLRDHFYKLTSKNTNDTILDLLISTLNLKKYGIRKFEMLSYRDSSWLRLTILFITVSLHWT